MRARLHDEAGFSLTELLAILLIMVIVVGAIFTTGTAADRLGTENRESTQAVRDAQSAVYAMTRELRQATRIMPTGTASGTCPSTATASCIDFLVRVPGVDSATGNHPLQRVRLDCTAPYTPPKPDSYASTYRSCLRYESTATTDGSTPAPATVRTGTLVERILNWTTGTCSAADPNLTCPVFAYRRTDSTSSSGWTAAAASTNTTGSTAQRIDVTLQVPSRGETGSIDEAKALLVQDGAHLRNVLR